MTETKNAEERTRITVTMLVVLKPSLEDEDEESFRVTPSAGNVTGNHAGGGGTASVIVRSGLC